MKNIDKELNEWVIHKIEKEYKEDIALLIGQKGACKIPTDEQNVVFDFFVPATKRGFQLARTFVIEDMGYDLYPNTWERLENIVDLKEPRMIFAFAKGEILYARSREDKEHYEKLKERLSENLLNKKYRYRMSLEHVNTAMEIYQTMIFEDSLCLTRKAAGGISSFLMTAIAFVNGTYLKNGYGNLTLEMKDLADVPDGFDTIYHNILESRSVKDIRDLCYTMLKITRKFFLEQKPKDSYKKESYNFDDLASWYQEARYSFRRIEYYCKNKCIEDVFLLGCYLQIEFDAIKLEFGLKEMDLLGVYDSKDMKPFLMKAMELETYILQMIKEHNAHLQIYKSFEDFIKMEG